MDAAVRVRSSTKVVASEVAMVGCMARIVPHKSHTLK
jgi:hypothetical protein